MSGTLSESRLAVIFPGQGSQYVGMAIPILDRWPGSSLLLEEASDALHQDVNRLMRRGPAHSLARDLTGQVTVYLANALFWGLCRERDLRPKVTTGYSMGFYSALMAAGVFDFSAGLAMIVEAGRRIEEASRSRPGRMAAIIGLPEEEVEAICREVGEEGYVGVANLNASRQVVISGDRRAVEAVCSLALSRGALEVKEIGVGAAYHSPLMEEVSHQFARYLKGVVLKDPEFPVLSYVDVEYVKDKERARLLLSLQLRSQVRWRDCIQRLVREGVDSFLEVGPGQVLSRLIRWIDREVKVQASDDPSFLSPLLEGERRGEIVEG
jgi:[acyl-carrier-protein] S-malonyltransferase